jgi:thiamine-phosphate pyrophosphorylase
VTRRAAFRCMLVVATGDVARRADVIAAALAGGVDAVQLRDRDADGGALLAAARTLRALTSAYGAALLVNDRTDVAIVADADGVHLPAAGLTIVHARALVRDRLLVGRSTHGADEARAAAAAGADYVILGPIFATPSKHGYGAPLGADVIRAARSTVPVIAIGGIDGAQAGAVRRAGADGIAVVRAILEAPDAALAARALAHALDAVA